MATITEDYVSFETAKLLKEKGFNEPTLAYAYGNDMMSYYSRPRITYPLSIEAGKIPMPTLQMAMKWLREVYNINIDIVPIWNQKRFEYQVFVVTPENAKHCYIDDNIYLDHEQACEAAIKYCLENLIK